MIMEQEQHFLKAKNLLAQMIEFVEQAGEDDLRIDSLERELFAKLLAVGHCLIEAHIARLGDGDVGATIDQEEKKLRRLEDVRERRYVSIFGEHAFERCVYAPREKQKIERVPVDEQLGLPAGEYSYVLQDWHQRFCLKESFEEAGASLESLLGIRIPVGTGERMNQHLAEQAEAFRFSQPAPDLEEEGELLVYANDCKGVPMRRELFERVRSGRRGKGEKANKKQMACVGAAYSIDRFVRSADDILDEVIRKQRAADRPQPNNKRLWAEMTRASERDPLNGKTHVFIQQAVDLQARDPDKQKTVVCLTDGERALRKQQHDWLPRAIGILDLWHVIERLWAVAHCFHAETSDAAGQFVEDRLRMLLEGKVGYVIGYFRRLQTAGLSAAKRATIRSAITYFENNREYMRYDEYLAEGYPIGSGVAEGACRHVVRDRMEMTGMRWTVHGAQSMLHLRAIYLNDDWHSYLDYFIQKEQAALYGQQAA